MAEKRELPILRVVQIGNDEFERYLIEEEQSEMVWTGERFDSGGGAVYAHHHIAASDLHNILKSNFNGIQPQRFVVPLYVEAYGHGPVSVAQVAEYLSKASRLGINTPEHGNGPADALVLPWIEWSRIEPLMEFPND